jgi:hypothetical protein
MASSASHSVLIASPEVHTTMSEMTTKTAVRLFHPRSKEYRDAGFDDEYIERRERETRFHIPEHQRFYVWKPKQETDLIDTILRNYPIPDFIVSDTEIRGLQHQEDGQQRMTAIWRYFHNLFPYTPTDYVGVEEHRPYIYYSEIPSNPRPNSFIMDDICPRAKRQMEEYRIYIKEIKIDETFQDTSQVICTIFERLNSGKPLQDGDKLWNRKNTPAVELAIQLSQDEDVRILLSNVFNINIAKIISSDGKAYSKKSLCSMVAIVLGLSVQTNTNTWADVMTTSFLKVCPYLNSEIATADQVKKGIIAICETLDDALVGEDGHKLTTKENVSLNRHLGIMIYDWRTRFVSPTQIISEDDIEQYKAFWIEIIEYFQNSCYELDDYLHPITGLYVDGDKKNKGASECGRWIRSRYDQLIIKAQEWGVEYL